MRHQPVLHHATVPCPRCEQPIGIPVTVVAVAARDGEPGRGVRFLATAPPAVHRCPDLSEGWL